MAKEVFPRCALSNDIRSGSPKCIWDKLRVLEVNQARTKQRTEYQCRFCGDVKNRVETVQ